MLGTVLVFFYVLMYLSIRVACVLGENGVSLFISYSVQEGIVEGLPSPSSG